jgi:formylglycine-generating enzyme required for sulfatase activity/type II secretory pathway pseudopilin PulG
MNNYNSKAFTILEIIITIVFVVIVTAPILNTFQLSQRMSERSRRSFIAQNLAREIIDEISGKNFSDPDGADTFEINLKPGPTHEEYIGEDFAPKIANGTDEVSDEPRLFNETVINRAKYYDDIDDYDGYNTDENILPTDAAGNEFIYDGMNVYRDFRVKVRVSNDAAFSGEPSPLLETGEVIGAASLTLAATRDSKYILLTDPASNLTNIFNTRTFVKLDNQPNEIAPFAYGDGVNTPGSDPISLVDLRETPFGTDIEGKSTTHIYKLGPAAKTITGPAGDRFYTLHTAAINDADLYSAISGIDMNVYNTPEVSFHKIDDINLVARDLRSNSINAITVDSKNYVYAATNGAGVMRSDDNGETWAPVPFYRTDGVTPVTKVNCLAATKYSERYLSRSVVLAGGDGGLLIIENNTKKQYRESGISDAQNVTALAAAENAYTAAGLDDGTLYISKNFAMKYEDNSSSMTKKRGPDSTRINSLSIDDEFRLWLANGTGIYYSEDIFINTANELCSWKQFTSEVEAGALYIDRSRTMPAPFIKVLDRAAPGITCAPSLLADANGLHLFYLDDSTDGGAGATLANPKLWYARSADFGKTWGTPVRVCNTPQGKAAWAHSEAIDRSGTLHALWQSQIYKNEWNIFYQRSENCGKKWLAEDKCAFNRFGEKPLHSYNFKNGPESEWVKYGSDKLSRIGVSNNNTVYGTASGNDFNQYHYSYLSPSGGLDWNSDYVISVFKPSDMASGYVESINVLNDKNKVINFANFGENYSNRIFFEAEMYARTVNVNLSTFNLTNLIESMPPAFNEELNFLYCYSKREATSEITLNSMTSFYPYLFFNNVRLEVSPDRIFRPQLDRNNAYLFFGVKSDASINSADISGRAFMARSDNGGNTYSSPIFIDYLYGVYDHLTSAKYNSKIYILKKTADKSPGSNFALSSIPRQLVFYGAGGSAFSFDCDMAPINAADKYDLNEKVNAFCGDDEGNLLCASSKGLYIRNIKNANAIINNADRGAGNLKTFALFPLRLDKNEKFSDPLGRKIGWQKLFEGMHITGAHIEKSGNYWISTLQNGIYRTTDYGASWTHIESRLSNIIDVSRVERGNAKNMNKLNLVTRRFNVSGESRKVVLETLFIIYNLAKSNIESSSILTAEEVENAARPDADAKCPAAAASDNSKIFYYNPADSSIYYKKPDISAVASHQLFDSIYGLKENFNHLEIEVEKNDLLELSFNGRLKARDYKQSLLPAAIANITAHSDPPVINSFELKLNDEIEEFSHSCSKLMSQGGRPMARMKNYADTDPDGGEKSYINEANCFIDIKIKKEAKKLNIAPLNDISKIVCGPDGDTLYAISAAGNKVYFITGLKEMKDIKTIEYSNNIIEPVTILFSPFSPQNRTKAFVACKSNIVELSGEKLISSQTPYEIGDSLITDNNELVFYDKLSRQVYKCPRTHQKTVFVTVVDKNEGSMVSMPPLNISKKFFSYKDGAAGLNSRRYISYNYIYTSRDFPAGIRPENPQRWNSQSDTDESVLNVYVIDSLFETNSQLDFKTDLTIKFATADKRLYPDKFSGKSNSILKCISGRLIISGDKKDRVLFTSIDDATAPPSIYNAPDGVFKSGEGLCNMQLRSSKYEDSYYLQKGGVRYADWGVSDGTPEGSFGGVYLLGGIDSSFMQYNVESRYALFYTRHLYASGNLPSNFNDYETTWNKTNVYVIDYSSELKLKTSGMLKIKQGSIVKLDTNSSFIIEATHDTIYPRSTFISDGSPYAPVVFEPLSLAGSKEGQTPYTSVLLDWYKLFFYGTAEVCNIRNTEFKTVGNFVFDGANAYLNNCDISGTIIGPTAKTIINFKNNSTAKLINNRINLFYPAHINITNDSSPVFSRNDFNFTYSNGQGNQHEAFIECCWPSISVFDSNNFYDGYISGSASANKFNGSKIIIHSIAYIDNNYFLNTNQPVPPEGGTSCEIYISSKNQFGNYVGSWVQINNNYFLNNHLPLYIEDFFEADIFKNRIKNNYFINSSAIASQKNDSINSAGLAKFVQAQKAVADNEGNIYIVDKKSGAYYKFNSNGNIIMRAGASGMGNGESNSPTAIAVNTTGEVYIADTGNKRIQKYDKYGNFLLKFARFGETEGALKNPSAMASATLNNSEVLLVADSERGRLLKYTNQGEFIEEIGGEYGGFNKPLDLAVSADHKFVYVADSLNNRIAKVQLNIDEYKTERLSATAKPYSASGITGSGFEETGRCVEGDYFEIEVAAKNSDGSANIDYKPRARGKITTDFTGGALLWEGKGIADNSASASDNGAVFDETAFNKGRAKFYVRSSAAGNIKILISDNNNEKLKGEIILNWAPEAIPWGLSCIGTNDKGFRRYQANNDPEVKFIKIPGANFERGNDGYSGGFTGIKMGPYYIAETLTTNAQFNRWRSFCPDAPGLKGLWRWNSSPEFPLPAAKDYPDHPAVFLSYDDAKNYCYWLLRGANTNQNDIYLPSEAQYEKAMRGANLEGIGNSFSAKGYPWGNSFSTDLLNSFFIKTPDERILFDSAGTTPVYKYRPQGYYGLYDISGNAYSWCRDWYSERYPGGRINPVNIITAEYKVIRGGSWKMGDDNSFKCSARKYALPAYNFDDIGVRPCLYSNK